MEILQVEGIVERLVLGMLGILVGSDLIFDNEDNATDHDSGIDTLAHPRDRKLKMELAFREGCELNLQIGNLRPNGSKV